MCGDHCVCSSGCACKKLGVTWVVVEKTRMDGGESERKEEENTSLEVLRVSIVPVSLSREKCGEFLLFSGESLWRLRENRECAGALQNMH